MPLIPGSNVSDTIRELRTGKTFAHTAAKFGKQRAQAQSVAIALNNARKGHLAAGGVVPHFDAGGAAVNPVTAIINALSAGAGTSGIAAPPGSTNPSAPSSVASTTSTAPPAANTQAQAQGVAPAAGATPNAATATPAAVGVVATPNNPIQQKLMARGGALKRADGGFNVLRGPNLRPPYYERNVQRQLHVGPVLSNVPGRTDNHRVKVPAGSYVLPASHVSSVGNGNSLAGMSIIGRMFNMTPYGGGPMPKMPHGAGLPKPPKPVTSFAGGGYSEGGSRGAGHFEPVPVDISGGEVVLPPEKIIEKFGSLKLGHKVLDKWIMDQRKKEIAIQRKLPPPAKK